MLVNYPICTDSLNPRELLLSAALARSARGDLAASANLLESAVLEHPEDVVALKYTQQAYYLLG